MLSFGVKVRGSQIWICTFIFFSLQNMVSIERDNAFEWEREKMRVCISHKPWLDWTHVKLRDDYLLYRTSLMALFRKQSSVRAIPTTHRYSLSNCGIAMANSLWRWASNTSITYPIFRSQILYAPNSETDLIDYSAFMPMKCPSGRCPLSDFVKYTQRYIPKGVEVCVGHIPKLFRTQFFRIATSDELLLLNEDACPN